MTEHAVYDFDLTYTQKARWDIVNRMTHKFIEGFVKQEEFNKSIIKISDKYTTCKYCGDSTLRWAETTKGYRLVSLAIVPHACKNRKIEIVDPKHKDS